MKVNAYKYTLITTLNIILLLLSSCQRNSNDALRGAISDRERVPMNFILNGAGTSGDDELISSVRAIIFDEDGKIVINDIVAHKTVGSVTSIEANVVRGKNNIYILCNETSELKSKLSAVSVEGDIEKIKFNSVGVEPPIPMYGKVENAVVTANRDGSNVLVNVGGTEYSKLEVNVIRMLAKISFTAIKNVLNANDDFTIEELRIRVCRMPLYNTIAKDVPYNETEWTSEGVTAVGSGKLSNNGQYDVVDEEYTVPTGVDKVTFQDIYIPENIPSSKGDLKKATYIMIDATCKMKNGSTQLIHSLYTVVLAHTPNTDYSLIRNNYYKIYATITGMGAMGIYAEIKSMDLLNIPINWKPIDGLVIVSDKESDYNKNINIWSDYNTYFGLLKTYHSDKGYSDVLFKYGSLIAIHNDKEAASDKNFVAPSSALLANDIFWYPSVYGNPYGVINNWATVPYVSTGDVPLDNSNIAYGIGDPCKLVGLSPEQILEGEMDNRQWRMATPNDYNTLIAASDKNANTSGYKAFHQHLIPNVKVRDNNGVLSASTNNAGKYWTYSDSKAFSFASETVGSEQLVEHDRASGVSVRCVRTVIPDAQLVLNGSPSFSYRGNTTVGSNLYIGSNMSYWTATLIEDQLDLEVGNSTEFQDFSFSPGDTNVKSASGSYTQVIPVYVKKLRANVSRTYRLRITGLGFKGDVKTIHATVFQNGYKINLDPSFDPIIDDANYIPKLGGTYKIKINITPTDVPIPAGKISVVAKYGDTVIAQGDVDIPTETYKYEYEGITISIPANPLPDERGIVFSLQLKPESGSYDTEGTLVHRMQKNK